MMPCTTSSQARPISLLAFLRYFIIKTKQHIPHHPLPLPAIFLLLPVYEFDLLWEPYIRWLTCLSLCVWLISPHIASFRFIHICSLCQDFIPEFPGWINVWFHDSYPNTSDERLRPWKVDLFGGDLKDMPWMPHSFATTHVTSWEKGRRCYPPSFWQIARPWRRPYRKLGMCLLWLRGYSVPQSRI